MYQKCSLHDICILHDHHFTKILYAFTEMTVGCIQDSEVLCGDTSSLVQEMAWCLLSTKPLPEPVMTRIYDTTWGHLYTNLDFCILWLQYTRQQWVKVTKLMNYNGRRSCSATQWWHAGQPWGFTWSRGHQHSMYEPVTDGTLQCSPYCG